MKKMILMSIVISLVSLLMLEAPLVADPPESGIGGTQTSSPGKDSLITEWETPLIKGQLITFEGVDDPLMTRPGWAVT